MNTIKTASQARSFFDNEIYVLITWELLEKLSKGKSRVAVITKDLLTNNESDYDKQRNIECGTTPADYLQIGLDFGSYSPQAIIALANAFDKLIPS